MHPTKHWTYEPSVSRLASIIIGLKRFHIPFLLVIAIATRIKVFFNLETVILGWRPADLASIAMNFYRNGFRLSHPQIYWGGNGPGYVEMEFPIVPYFTALLYKVFGIHDVLAVILPFVCGIATVIVLYLLATRLQNAAVGVIAALFVAISPLMTFHSQMLMIDTPLLFCSVLGLHMLMCWMEGERWLFLSLAAVSISMAVLLKLTALYLGIPIAYLFFVKFRWSFWKQPAFWLFGLVVLLPPVAWYLHAQGLYQQYHNTFGILSGGYNKFARAELLLSTFFYKLIAGRIIMAILTPFVFVLFLYGFSKSQQYYEGYLFHVWAAAIAIYILAIAEGNKDMNYYQLPLLPPAAALASAGLFTFLDKVASNKWFGASPARETVVFNLVFLIFLASTVAANVRFSRVNDAYFMVPAKQLKIIGQRVAEATEPGSLLIVATSYGNAKTPEQIDTPPDIFYFSDRRGWYCALTWLDEEKIEHSKREGARYLVVPAGDVGPFKTNHMMYNYLSSHYTIVLDEENCLVFDLEKPTQTAS
jgi:hypothetical protein